MMTMTVTATAMTTMTMTTTPMMTTIMMRTATEMTMTSMATTSMTRMRMKTTMTTMPTENSRIIIQYFFITSLRANYKSKDSLNNDDFISRFGSQFKLLAVVLHRLLLCCPCKTLPYHPSPLLSPHCLSPYAAPLIASFLVAPPSLLHRLFVELPPLSPHRRLSLSRISRFALLPRRRRCRPTQFAATGLPPSKTSSSPATRSSTCLCVCVTETPVR